MSEIEKLEQKISELRDDILTNPNNKDKKAIILKAIKFLLTKIPEAREKDKKKNDEKYIYTPDEVKEQLSLPIELTNQYKGMKIKPDLLGKKNVWVVVRKKPMLMFKYLDRKKDTFLDSYIKDSNIDLLDGKVYVNWDDKYDGVFYDPDTFEKIGYINKKYGKDYLKLILNPLGEKILKKLKGKGIDSCWEGYEAIGMKMKNNKLVPNCVPENISLYSNPKQVMKNAKKYLGKDVSIELSNKKDKKYMVYNPNTKKWVYFGQIGYEDFTKHKDPKRRENYLKRTANMKGNWKDDKYSPNNLSRNLLW